MVIVPRRCLLSCRAVHRATRSSSAFSRCSSGTSGSARGWRRAALTGWRRGSSRSWYPTRSLLRRGRASFCDICQHTSSRPPFAGLSVAPWNKDDMGDGVPTDQLSHNHCDCTDSHCNSHIVTSCVFVLVLRSHHKSIGGRLLLLPQAARDGLALCHLSRQDTSRGAPSQGRNWSKVCVRVEGSRSLA